MPFVAVEPGGDIRVFSHRRYCLPVVWVRCSLYTHNFTYSTRRISGGAACGGYISKLRQRLQMKGITLPTDVC